MSVVSEILKKKQLSIGIFGIGKSNVCVIEYLRKLNPSAKFTLRSDNAFEDGISFSAERFFCGKNAFDDIDENILFLSPSVNRSRREIVEAQKQGVIIFSDAELFFEKTNVLPICVTGSDGKSTTTHLIAEAISNEGIPSIPCGNYGRGLCSVIDEPLFPVIELSSFQLNYMKPRSQAAIITNITPNHLNWHSSFDEYIEAKINITYNSDKVIFDSDSDILTDRFKKSNVYAKTSLTKSYEILKAIGGAENYVTYKNETIYINEFPFINISKAKRKESYNIRNFLLTVSASMNQCSESAISDSINSFFGLPHRAEKIFEHNGIKYLDSSIDSSPERTIKTLSALSEKPVVIIGGLGKHLPLNDLAYALPKLTRGAVLLGEVGFELEKLLSESKKLYPFYISSTMLNAVSIATELARPIGTVILSPAATSFDNYKNFSERGNDFKQCVLSLFR